MIRVNFTVELEDKEEYRRFKNWLEQHIAVSDFRILPDTDNLYETSTTFRGLCKAEKLAKRAKNDYINLKN